MKKVDPKKPKIFGTVINEDDASQLVGGIVEKGFSEQVNRPTTLSSVPRPTVLPFPVARHRSHGPHWSPKVGYASANNDHDDEANEEDEEDLTGMDQIGAFAKPVKRKEKKGMNFSQWRQIVASANSVVPKKRVESGHKVKSASIEKNAVSEVSQNKNSSNECRADKNENGMESQDFSMEDDHMVKVQEEDVAMDMEHTNIPVKKADSIFVPREVEARNNVSSLENEIDAENQAQLTRMSADEIAEAQAEVMAKLSPALLETLKRKGQEKMKRGEPYRSSSDHSGEKSNFADHMKNTTSHGTLKNAEDDTPKLSEWDTWSKRVESVREVRYSLDGNIVKSEFEVPKNDNFKFVYLRGSKSETLSLRDYLRTEGDPGAAGYTIKEALALTRSMVPGQRTLGVHLIASVLDRAIHNIYHQSGCIIGSPGIDGFDDWEAIWAFTLGPEPELALSLRLCMDDNYNSVVMTCARAIQSVLTFDINEEFFEIVERIPTLQRDAPTAPVFRSRPEIEDGYLHGGFWKYNAKPSNIRPFALDYLDNEENERTIQDDVVAAEQDIAAGFIRMGILERVQCLLVAEPSAELEDYLICILIAVARHSPTCAAAVMKCQGLVQTLINRFSKDQTEISTSKIKSVKLLRILARFDKENCLEFLNTGSIQKMTWHLYVYTSSFDQWVKSGKEACKLSSALLVEQLRLWKVCVQHGYCDFYFSELYPALCIWLNVPAFEKLIENDVLREYASIARESYLVLGAFSRRLPRFYIHLQQPDVGTTKEGAENWCWTGPVIDSALEWFRIKEMPLLCRLFEWKNEEKVTGGMQDSAVSPFLWLISSIMDMLSAVLEAVIPEDNVDLCEGSLPWLPDFVPKIGLEIIKNEIMGFSGISSGGASGESSFLEHLCSLRKTNGKEVSTASSSCLQGLLRVARYVDKLIPLARNAPQNLVQHRSFTREEKILADGILRSSLLELTTLMASLVESNGSEWHHVKSMETFGRGGPAPGIGIGWGAPGGGFWSKGNLSTQVDVRLFIYLLDVFPIICVEDQFTTEGMNSVVQKINSVMAASLLVGPMDSSTVDKLLHFLFQVHVLKYIGLSIRRFIDLNQGFLSFKWVYEEEDYSVLSTALTSHFKKRWLFGKQKKPKSSAGDEQAHRKTSKKGSVLLDTIPEDPVTQEPNCLVAEWAHQRLPLPLHWFLSPLSALCSTSHESQDFLKVAKGGLFFLLGIELMSTFLPAELRTPVRDVPIIWKLHALSVALLSGMGIFEEDTSRDLFRALQDFYGKQLVDAKELKFKTDIHDSYSTFVENLVGQFAAESYGDMVFGRQVGVYLHRSVEAPVRFAAWHQLSNACALELLPPLDKCIASTYCYLQPVEDDERMLEAYCKSWVSGALDKAASRRSASFTLALHHLSSFIFHTCSGNMLPLRNKLVKSLLRDYSHKKQHQVFFIDLVKYQGPDARSDHSLNECSFNVLNRLQTLKEACDGNSSLLTVVDKLSSLI